MNGKTQGWDPELSALAQEGGAVAQSQKREGTTGRYNGEQHNGRTATGKWCKMRNVTFIFLILLKK